MSKEHLLRALRNARRNNSRRRNGSDDLTVEDVIEVAETGGFPKLAARMRADRAFAEAFTAQANEILNEPEDAVPDAAPAVVPSSGGAITDAQGWSLLAGLVDRALPDLDSEQREKLKAAFMARSLAASGTRANGRYARHNRGRSRYAR